ncbi:MAG: dTDP-4-dehydrorhamnose reductase [Thermaerobacter sp.]|nr:dTDP-4-dehydrorhamnose reductase [Thermaerobacter sp.]
MRILVTGAGGQLGTQLARRLASVHQVAQRSHAQLDVADLAAVRDTLRRERPQVVLHCAAMTNVDRCEEEPEAAFRVNALGSRNVAAAAQELGALLVYVSTDYVFNGEKGAPYTEFDPVDPVNVYGHSKLAGEEFVRELCPRHLIVRTAWLYSGRGKSDFVHTVRSLLEQGQPIRMVDDQRGSPTWVPDLTAALEQLLQREAAGLYHLAGGGACSRFEFARTIARLSGHDPEGIRPVPTSAFPRPARRPRDSSLDGLVLRLEGQSGLRPWPEALEECLTS